MITNQETRTPSRRQLATRLPGRVHQRARCYPYSLSPEREYVYWVRWFACLYGPHRDQRPLSGNSSNLTSACFWPSSVDAWVKLLAGNLTSNAARGLDFGRHLERLVMAGSTYCASCQKAVARRSRTTAGVKPRFRSVPRSPRRHPPRSRDTLQCFPASCARAKAEQPVDSWSVYR